MEKNSGCLLNGKDVLAVLPAGFGESAIFQLFVRVKRYMSKDSACILVICLLRGLMEEQIAEANSKGLDNEFSSRSFASRRGCGKISIVILVSLFMCCFHFSGVFCDIPSIKVYRLPKLQIFLVQGLQTRSEKCSSRSMEMPVFFKTS